ncbi:hypothetical protein ACXC9Q_40720 [Kribbella sp. CWNU-51]
MLTAAWEAEFPYGVLLITDAESTEQVPSWDSPEEPVAASGLVVRIRHADEGEVTVRVVDSPGDAAGGQIFAGELEVKSGVLKISDALSAAHRGPGHTWSGAGADLRRLDRGSVQSVCSADLSDTPVSVRRR